MVFFVKQRLYIYKKYKLDMWGVVRNSFLIEKEWCKFNYHNVMSRYKRFNEARKHNLNKIRNKKYDINFGKRLNMKFLFKLKVYRSLIRIVFKIKPSKKLNKVCLFFFNRKRRRRNFDWWKKKFFIYEVRDVYVKKKDVKLEKSLLILELQEIFI